MDNAAEILALCNNKDNMGSFGGLFGLVVLFLLFGMFGANGAWGNGNNAATQGALTRAELADGFNTAQIQRTQSDIVRDQFGLQADVFQNRFDVANGFNATQREIMENRFTSQQCCCDTQKEIIENRYTTQLAFNNLQAQLAQCCCDLKTTMHNEGEATRALINANTVQALRDNLQSAQLQLGQLSQTQTILAAMNPTPRPAYLTYSPYQSVPYQPAAPACGAACC